MLTIGLTGGIGSGKTTVAELFKLLGITVVDADEAARKVTIAEEPALDDIAQHFGETILNEDGTLDRKRLRSIIFKQPKERLWLENLLHPLIRDEMQKQVRLAQSPYCVVVIPLLTETQPHPLADRILVIDCSREMQIQRTRLRDEMTREEIEAILDTQANHHQRLAAADDIIINETDIDHLKEAVQYLHEKYLALTQAR